MGFDLFGLEFSLRLLVGVVRDFLRPEFRVRFRARPVTVSSQVSTCQKVFGGGSRDAPGRCLRTPCWGGVSGSGGVCLARVGRRRRWIRAAGAGHRLRLGFGQRSGAAQPLIRGRGIMAKVVAAGRATNAASGAAGVRRVGIGIDTTRLDIRWRSGATTNCRRLPR